MIIIGIDLGTTFSCAYVYDRQNDKFQVITFSTGKTTTASSVDLNHRPAIIGVPSQFSITEVKRLIGMRYDSPEVQMEINEGYYPYEIIPAEDGYCKIKFKPQNQQKEIEITPEEISAIVLRYIRNEALRILGMPNTTEVHCVVTIPAFFTDDQKDRTMTAVQMANMNLLGLYYEPSAAAYAYQETVRQDGYYLAYDLGGGTFDLTIMLVSNQGNKIKYIRTSGDTHLGGIDFDKNFTEKILEIWEDKDPDENSVRLFRPSSRDTQTMKKRKKERMFTLRKIAEEAKIQLSQNEFTEIDLSKYYNGSEFTLEISREQFEECNQHLFDKTIEITRNLFKEAKINKNQIRQILLIGGSSQIPKIQQMLHQEFPKAHINNTIDCNQVVAKGAAMYAKQKADGEIVLVTEVTAHEIKMDSIHGPLTVINKGTDLPIINQELAVQPQGGYSDITLFENDKSIGKYRINNTPSGCLMVTFLLNVSNDGILNIQGQIPNGPKVDVSCNLTKKSGDVKEIQRVQQTIDKYFA